MTFTQIRYATFAAMASVDATDRQAIATGVPGPDSVNVWSIIADGANSTRCVSVTISFFGLLLYLCGFT